MKEKQPSALKMLWGHATRAAVEAKESSWAAALYCFAPAKKLRGMKVDGDEQIGVDIIKRACEEPIRQIVNNAGVEGAIIIGKIRESDEAHFGYNAQTDKYEDLVKSGVIDPAKVTRSALQNAASIAGLMLTTEAMVCDIPEKKSGSGWRRESLTTAAPKAWTTKPVLQYCNEDGRDSRKGSRPFRLRAIKRMRSWASRASSQCTM